MKNTTLTLSVLTVFSALSLFADPPIAGFREGGSTFGLWQQAFTNESDPDPAFAKKAKLLKDLSAVPPKTAAETNALVRAATDYANALIGKERMGEAAAFSHGFRTDRAALLSPVEKERWLARELGCWSRAGEEARYRRLCAAFERLPVDDALVDALTVVKDLLRFWRAPRWPEIVRLSQPLAAARGRFAGSKRIRVESYLLSVAAGTDDVAGMKRAWGNIAEANREIARKWAEEDVREKAARAREAEARKNRQKIQVYRRDPSIERPNVWWSRGALSQFTNEMLKRGEWAAAVPALEEQLDRRNPNAYINLLKAEARLGHLPRVRELAAVLAGTNTTANANHKFEAAAVLAWFDAKDAKSLRANLAKLRGDRNEQEWFELLRRAGRIYFSFDSSERRADWLREVIAMSRELLWPEERVEYALTWMEDAPRSAETALKTGLFQKLKTENRLARYNCYSLFEREAEVKLAKSNPAPHLAADQPGREAAVAAAYDAWGLHVYVRLNDPEAEKAKDGLSHGFSCEYDFQPGGEAPWHWNMITRADRANVDQGAVWDSPRKGFKVGAEYIVEDSYTASDCHVFHVFIPWILCYREFPKDGDVWRMVIAADWAGQFGTLGGGAVHELGRAMQMKFVLPPAARKKMTRKLLREAVYDYHKVRDKWENALFWGDPHLGDPAFNEAVAKPFVAACDKLAEECVSDKLTDERAAEILATDLSDLADFRLALDKRRADYVKAKLFSR